MGRSRGLPGPRFTGICPTNNGNKFKHKFKMMNLELCENYHCQLHASEPGLEKVAVRVCLCPCRFLASWKCKSCLLHSLIPILNQKQISWHLTLQITHKIKSEHIRTIPIHRPSVFVKIRRTGRSSHAVVKSRLGIVNIRKICFNFLK